MEPARRPEDKDALRQLDDYFAPSVARLAAEFGPDVTRWWDPVAG